MLRLLGGVSLEIDGVEVALSPQEAELLAILASEGGRPVSVAAIVDRLWVDTPPKTAVKIVHVVVSRLRRVLGPRVARTAGGYRLNAGATDVDQMMALIEQAKDAAPADPATADEKAQEALALWRGRPYGDLADAPWARPVVTSIEELHRQAVELRSQLLLSTSQDAEAIVWLTEAARAEPLRERRWGQLMLALYRCGRQADALRVFDDTRSLLREELGLEPGPELRRLQLAILQHDPSLEVRVIGDGDRDVAEPSSFIGRDGDLRAIEQTLETNRLVTLVGLGGMGKTRLAREIAHRHRLRGQRVLWTSLVSVRNDDHVARHVAEDFGFDVDDPSTALPIVLAGIGHGGALVVIDGAEHRAGAAAELVLRIVDACPRARALVTSRVPVGIGAERVVNVGPLAQPTGDGDPTGTALELLLDRSGLVLDLLDAPRRALLDRLCTATAGVPLFIELVARTVDFAEPSATVTITDHADAIRGATTTALQNVEESVRKLYSSISVLPSGCSERTAVGLGDLGEDATRRALRQLTWSHLLKPEVGRHDLRFRVLDPIREVLLIDLGRAQREVVIGRAVEDMRTRLEAVRPPGQPAVIRGLEEIDDDHDNLRFLLSDRLATRATTALTLAIPACEYWPVRGHIVEGRQWLEEAMAAATPTGELLWRSVVALARTTRTFAEVALLRDRLEAVVDEMERCRADQFLLGTGLMYLAMARGWSGDRVGAADALDRAGTIDASIGTPWTTANLDHLKALGRVLDGDVLGARDGQRTFARRMEALDDQVSAAMGWYLAASLADMAGLVDNDADLARARSLAADNGDVALLGQLLRLDARRLQRTGDARARATLADAAADLERSGGVRAAALARRDLAVIALDAGDLIGAEEQGRRALVPLLQLERPAAAIATATLAAIAARYGDEPTAARLVRASVDLWSSPGAKAPEDQHVLDRLLMALPLAAPEALSVEDIVALVGVG